MGEQGRLPKGIPLVGGLSYVNFLALIGVILLFGTIISNIAPTLGVPAWLQLSVIGYGAPGAAGVPTGQGAQVVSPTVSVQQEVTTVDIGVAVKESIKDSTGVNTQRPGTVAWYYEGDVTPFESTTATATTFASSTTDARPGTKIMGIFTNTSFYTTKIANEDGSLLDVPYSPTMTVTGFADLINSLTIKCQNTTSGNWQATGMTQTLTTDEAATLTCRLEGGTARGVARAPFKLGLNYDTANWTSSGTYIVNGVSGTVPTGIFSGYEAAYDVSASFMPTVTDFDSGVTFQIHLTPASGVNPDDNITIEVADLGTYTKNIWPVLYQDYQNPDTLADVGVTNPTFVLDVN